MSFDISLSGLSASTTDLNTISNNIANSNTTGFKGSRAEFSDLFLAANGLASNNTGSGVTTATVAQQFNQGSISSTSNPLDMAISGNGFFTLANNGTLEYSRNGAFQTDATGYVVNTSGARLQVYTPLANGTFSPGTLKDLQISAAPNPPQATSQVGIGVDLPVAQSAPATSPFNPTDSTSYNATTSETIYDSLGYSHTMNLYYVQSGTPGSWTMYTTIDGSAVGTGTAVTFDSSGNLTAPAGGTVTLPSFTPTDGAAPITITQDLSGTIQYGSAFGVNSLTQNGYTTGQLSGVSVNNAGIVYAEYSNGQSVALGQVAMANFANPQGLRQIGNDTWLQTAASGQALSGAPGTSNFGTIQGSALESSNVDLTEQLVNLMNAQRSYQANAQAISADDTVLQSILHLQ